MLHTTKFEPAVGADALLDGQLVKVHQRLPGNQALVLGDRLTKRVDLAQLTPPPEPTLFERWLSERTFPGNDQIVTPAANLFADFHDWLDARDLGEAFPINPRHFADQMREAGHRSFIASWREPGDTQSRARRVYPLLLKATA